MAHPPALAPSPAAVRQRRLRERRRRGARTVLVEIDADLLAALYEMELIDSIEAADQTALAFGLSMLIAETIEIRRGQIKLNSSRVTARPGADVKSGV